MTTSQMWVVLDPVDKGGAFSPERPITEWYLFVVVFIYTTTFHNRLNSRSFSFENFEYFFLPNNALKASHWNLCLHFFSLSFSSHCGSLKKKKKPLLTMCLIGTLVLFFVSSIQLLDIQKRSAAILFCLLISSLHPRGEMSRSDRQTREKETLGFCFLIDKKCNKSCRLWHWHIYV